MFEVIGKTQGWRVRDWAASRQSVGQAELEDVEGMERGNGEDGVIPRGWVTC